MRLISGIVVTITGLVTLFVWTIPTNSLIAWGVTIALIVLGAFQIFEGWAGWCVVRAMGFKTRL